MSNDAQRAAEDFERAADELEIAVLHLRTTARHFREQEIPRACSHAFAAYGHMRTAQQIVDERAVVHSARSDPG